MIRVVVSIASLFLNFLMFAHPQASSQETPSETRTIKSDDFAKKRPRGNQKKPASRNDYVAAGKESPVARRKSPPPSGPVSKPKPSEPPQLIGVTLWKLRPAQPGDDPKQQILVKPTARATRTEMRTPVRASLARPMTVNDLVRLTVEAQKEGHLYIINRELRRDGSVGEAYLIFPETPNAHTRVAPGASIDVPDRAGELPYFRLSSAEADYSGELVTVIVSPKPLDWRLEAEGKIGNVALLGRLEAEAGDAPRFEQPAGMGEAETQSEREATSGSKVRSVESPEQTLQRRMTRDEPIPQTVYEVRPNSEGVIVLAIRLGVKK